MECVAADTRVRDPRHGRRMDLATKCFGVGKASIIQHNDQNVWIPFAETSEGAGAGVFANVVTLGPAPA